MFNIKLPLIKKRQISIWLTCYFIFCFCFYFIFLAKKFKSCNQRKTKMLNNRRYRPRTLKPLNHQVGRLSLTHGDPLNLRPEEISKLFKEPSSLISRESTTIKQLKSASLPNFNKSICRCIEPILSKERSKLRPTTEEEEPAICIKCGSTLYKEKSYLHVNTSFREKEDYSVVKINRKKKAEKKVKKTKPNDPPNTPINQRFIYTPPQTAIDQQRYQKAYIRALRVSKFGSGTPAYWPEFFDQEISRSYIFSYMTHTPRCLHQPHSCRHENTDGNKFDTPRQIKRHIFNNVKVEDYL